MRRNRFQSRPVAIPANAVVVAGGRITTRDVVRIVARGATQFADTFQEALGFAEPVRSVRDSKSSFLPGGLSKDNRKSPSGCPGT